MVITQLEAEVAIEKIELLQARFEEVLKNKPPSIIKTYLSQDINNKSICRLITVWNSREELQEMQKMGTPVGVLLFREFGVEPTLSVYEVIAQSSE